MLLCCKTEETRVIHIQTVLGPLARIAERGAVLSFDTFGSETYFDRSFAQEPRDTDRIECVLRILDKGY